MKRPGDPVGNHHANADQYDQIHECQEREGEVEIPLLIANELEKDVSCRNAYAECLLTQSPEENEDRGVKGDRGENKKSGEVGDQLQLKLGFDEVVF